MGYFLGHKIPEYNPFWEETEYWGDEPDYWKWYYLGYDDGHASYESKVTREVEMQQRIESLEALLSANVRIIKEELRKELNEAVMVQEGEDLHPRTEAS